MFSRSFFIFLLVLCTSCHNAKQSPSVKALPKVSVICPTYNREDRLPNLYALFLHQTYENRELLVLDDSPIPSSFFTNLQDERVKYIHIPNQSSIGSKRNLLCQMAHGDIIAHFDDDDYYAPSYLTTMVENLGEADLIKLSVWLAWKESDGSLWEWDTRKVSPLHYAISGWTQTMHIVSLEDAFSSTETKKDWRDKNLWGFGFSFVYRKSLWEQFSFENTSSGEDYIFVSKAQKAGKLIKHIPDSTHMTIHTLHPESTSKIFPQVHCTNSEYKELLLNYGLL